MAYRFIVYRTDTKDVDTSEGWILDFASDQEAFEYLKAYNEMVEFVGYPIRLECLDIPIKVRVENIEFEWI